MKYQLVFFTFLFIGLNTSFSQEVNDGAFEEIRLKQIENIKNPALWDLGRMQFDIDNANKKLPIRDGAFPVPHYDSLGSYRGGGFFENTKGRSIPDYRLKAGDREVVFCSFFIGNSQFYAEEKRNKVFFTIVSIIDTLNADNFAPSAVSFFSRNHPDYGGEGSFFMKKDRVDFVAFTTPDKGSFALVNMRLFHLEYGNIILIAPRKDGSLRSLQIKAKGVTGEEILEYLRDDVLKRDKVVKFFSEPGLIEF